MHARRQPKATPQTRTKTKTFECVFFLLLRKCVLSEVFFFSNLTIRVSNSYVVSELEEQVKHVVVIAFSLACVLFRLH